MRPMMKISNSSTNTEGLGANQTGGPSPFFTCDRPLEGRV